MKSWGAVGLLGGICAAVAVVLACTYTASQQVPDFYSEALAIDASAQEKASEEMGSRVTMLFNEVRRAGRWDVLFTAEQINGWLAVDLARKHPELITDNVHDPRVRIDDETVTLAARIDSGGFSTVFTLTFEPYLYEPNVIAFRIKKARAGLLPIPMNDVLREVNAAVKNLGVPLSWTQVEGDPVALLALVPGRDGDNGARSLDQLEVRENEIYVAGRTTPAGQMSAAPRGDLSQSLVNLAMLPEASEREKKRAASPKLSVPAESVPAAKPTGKAAEEETLLDVKPPPAEFPMPEQSAPPAPPAGK
jgi:hypothetical protein